MSSISRKWVVSSLFIVSACYVGLVFSQEPNPVTETGNVKWDRLLEGQDDIVRRFAEKTQLDPDCTGTITGHFIFNVRKQRPVTRTVMVKEMVWRTCWVYNPATCQNEIKRYQVEVEVEKEIEDTTVDVQKYCVKLAIPVEQIKNGLKCDCDDLPPSSDPTAEGGVFHPRDPQAPLMLDPPNEEVPDLRISAQDDQVPALAAPDGHANRDAPSESRVQKTIDSTVTARETLSRSAGTTARSVLQPIEFEALPVRTASSPVAPVTP